MAQTSSTSSSKPSNLLNQTWIRVAILFSSLLSLLQWILLFVYGWKIPPEIPLFYSSPIGVGQLADKLWFLIIPVISLVCILFSLVFVRLSRYLPPLFSYLIVWGTTLNVLLLLIVMIHIIYLVL